MRRILLASLAVLGFTPATFASFNIQYLNVSPGLTGKVTYNVGSGNQNINVHIGALNMVAYGPIVPNVNVYFRTFCIDLAGVMNGNQYAVTIEPISTFGGENFTPPAIRSRMAYLYDKYGDGSWENVATSLTNETAAAMQLAFWRLSLGASATYFGFSNLSGDFATVNGIYENLLAEVGGVDADPGLYDNWSGEWLKKVTSTGSGQNVMWSGFPPTNEPPQVPAPGGLVLAAAGGAFFSFTGLTRRFRKAV